MMKSLRRLMRSMKSLVMKRRQRSSATVYPVVEVMRGEVAQNETESYVVTVDLREIIQVFNHTVISEEANDNNNESNGDSQLEQSTSVESLEEQEIQVNSSEEELQEKALITAAIRKIYSTVSLSEFPAFEAGELISLPKASSLHGMKMNGVFLPAHMCNQRIAAKKHNEEVIPLRYQSRIAKKAKKEVARQAGRLDHDQKQRAFKDSKAVRVFVDISEMGCKGLFALQFSRKGRRINIHTIPKARLPKNTAKRRILPGIGY